MSWLSSKQILWLLALTCAWLGLAECEVRAQNISASGPSPEQGLPIAGVIFYPSFFAGAVFNDNVYLSTTNRRAELGARLRPSLEAVLDNGIHKFRAYVAADAQIYPGLSGGSGFSQPVGNSFTPTSGSTAPNNIQARVGISHLYRPLEDLTFNSSLSFLRQIGLIGAGFNSQPASLFTPSVTPVPTGVPQYYNTFTASTAVEKKFTERTFVRATGAVTATIYDNPANPSTQLLTTSTAQSATQATGTGFSLVSLQNGVNYSVGTRAGYWVNPVFNVFVETAGTFFRYSNSISDTNGFNLLSGLATDQIGLVKGEIYGGYRAQYGLDHRLGAIWAPSFGGRLLYTPTPYVTLAASVDESLGGAATVAVAPVSTAAIPVAALVNVKSFQARLQAEYAFSPYWRATLRGGYGLMRYTGLSRVDATWTAGFGLNYNFWRNFLVTLDYQFTAIDSNVSAVGSSGGFAQNLLPNSYKQSLLTAGVTYRY